LDALTVGLERKKVNWVLDADIRDFFGQLDRVWLRRFLEHRIADPRVLRLVDKWLAAGVVEDGIWSQTERGSAQGASVSPLLANVYLHYVFDLWVDWWRHHEARGDVIIVRFADDFTVGFQHRDDADRFPHRASRQVRQVRSGASPGQDAADRIRTLRGRTSSGAGAG
jgi:retron-type reverse transcriptase